MHRHTDVLLLLAGIAEAFGIAAIAAIDWQRTPGWVLLPITVFGLGMIGAAIGSSGGAESPAWVFLFFAVVLAAYFFSAPAAYVFALGCVATHASVLVYDGRATREEFLAQFMVAALAYLSLSGAIVAGKRRMWALRHRSERLAAEQGALRRVATAVVSGEEPGQIYARVGFEAAALLRGGAAGILKLENPETMVVTGVWADHPAGRYDPGTTFAIVPGSDVDEALRTGRPVRTAQHPPGSVVAEIGYSSSIVAPVRVSGALWGALAVSAAAPSWFTSADEQYLMEFCDMLATAIGSLEDRAKLAAQAYSDPLTGLANHRALQEAPGGRGGAGGSPRDAAVGRRARHRPLQGSQRQRRARDGRRHARRRGRVPDRARPRRGYARAHRRRRVRVAAARRRPASRRSSRSSGRGG